MSRYTSFEEVEFVPSLADAGPKLTSGRLLIVQRGRPRWLCFLCPCGCGSRVRLNLDARVGKRWRVWVNNGRATVFPSVWLDTGCRSHFLISSNRVISCDWGRASARMRLSAGERTVLHAARVNGAAVALEVIAEQSGMSLQDAYFAAAKLQDMDLITVEERDDVVMIEFVPVAKGEREGGT